MIDREKVREEFLIKLQMEYLTHALRSFIYRKKEYAQVSRDIALKKKAKIISLSKKFNIQTIFTGKDMVAFINEKFWSKNGLPNFVYKSVDQSAVQGNYDKWYMFYRGTKVLYNNLLMEVILNNPTTETLKIRKKGVECVVKYDEVILLNNYDFNLKENETENCKQK